MTITLTREEAQQVLDALIYTQTAGIKLANVSDAVETLRTRLSAPEPEEKKYTEESCPVCGYYCLGKGGVNCIDKPKLCGINTAPPQPEPIVEPVAWMWDVYNGAGYSSRGIGFQQTDIPFAKHTPLYTAPPQREWQGLTDEEIDELAEANLDFNWKDGVEDFARAIEAKLKEKNNG